MEVKATRRPTHQDYRTGLLNETWPLPIPLPLYGNWLERTSDKRIKVTAKNITLYPWEGIMAHKKRDHRVIIVIGEWNLTLIKAVLIVATLSGQGVGI